MLNDDHGASRPREDRPLDARVIRVGAGYNWVVDECDQAEPRGRIEFLGQGDEKELEVAGAHGSREGDLDTCDQVLETGRRAAATRPRAAAFSSAAAL